MYECRFSTGPSWMSEANVCWDVESKSQTTVLVYYQLVTRGQQVLDTMTANVIVEHRRRVNKQRVKSSEMMVSSSLLIVVLPRSKITWVWKRIDYGYESRGSIFRLRGRSGEPRVTGSLRSTYSVRSVVLVCHSVFFYSMSLHRRAC